MRFVRCKESYNRHEISVDIGHCNVYIGYINSGYQPLTLEEKMTSQKLQVSTAEGEQIQTILAVAQNYLTMLIREQWDAEKIERMIEIRSELLAAENSMHRAFEAL